jgi:leucyl-tRNA synthetase
VIQINGKKRAVISALMGIKESEVVMQAKESQYFKKNCNDKKIEKSIYIENRLLNLIVK